MEAGGAASAAKGSPMLAHLAFILTGASVCIPWQAYICSLDFFMVLLPGYPIQFLVGTVCMGILLVMTILMIPLSKVYDPLWMAYVTGSLIAVGVCVVPIMNLAFVLPAETPTVSVHVLFVIVIGAVMFSAVLNGAFQSCLYALAGELSIDGDLTASSEVGKGVAGLAIVAARMGTKASFAADLHGQARSTLIFFGCGFVLVVLSLIVFYMMMQMPVMAKRRTRSPDNATQKISDDRDREQPSSIAFVAGQIWRQAFTALVVFTVTLACFPGLTSTLKSSTLNLGDWFPIVLIALYNIGDLVGKSGPGYYNAFETCPQLTPYAALVHCVFLPLFIGRLKHPGLGDISALFAVFVLGCSTGYIACCAMMLAPMGCKPADKAMAGTISSMLLVSGLACGSFLGLGVGAIFG